MLSSIKRTAFRKLSGSERFGSFLVRSWGPSRKLKRMLRNEESDGLLWVLFRVMDFAFCLSKDYGRNIKNFDGQYWFDTRDGEFSEGVIFRNGYMNIAEGELLNPDVRITFENSRSILQFILWKQEDILDLLLENRMNIKGNVNLGLKFCYMVRELKGRIGWET